MRAVASTVPTASSTPAELPFAATVSLLTTTFAAPAGMGSPRFADCPMAMVFPAAMGATAASVAEVSFAYAF